jgi:hypothetical protein
MRGSFVYRKVKSGLVQELTSALVLYRAAPVTMTSSRLTTPAFASRSLSKSVVLGAFAQDE